MRTLLSLTFGRYRWFRHLMGGVWTKQTEKCPGGSLPWIPYEPRAKGSLMDEGYQMCLNDGWFEREEHPRRIWSMNFHR